MVVKDSSKRCSWLAGLALSVCAWWQHTEAAEVLTSIKPLALIAKELTLASDRVDYLLPAGVTPHAYSLRVSQMRQLHSADLVLWVGPELETFLQKPLAARAPERIMTLAEIDGLHWPESGSGVGQHHDHDHDMHLWLNPQNAMVVADALAQRLAALNPSAAERYAQRAVKFKTDLTALDAELEAQMALVAGQGFAVYHDGYRHWVERYGMKQVDYVTVTPEQRPGARHLMQLQARLRSEAKCLFIEPYSDVSEATRMADGLGLKVAELDPLASAESLVSYEQLLRHIAKNLSACLLGQGR